MSWDWINWSCYQFLEMGAALLHDGEFTTEERRFHMIILGVISTAFGAVTGYRTKLGSSFTASGIAFLIGFGLFPTMPFWGVLVIAVVVCYLLHLGGRQLSQRRTRRRTT